MENSSPSAVVWDEKHVKALLGLRRHFLRVIQAEPWQSWLNQRGGLVQVRQTLRNGPLLPNQRKLLDLVLQYPDSSTTFYTDKLNISPSSYFSYLNSLVQALLMQLNNWQVEAPSTLPTNLPAPLTMLIGAEKSIAAVTAALERPGLRLLTLTGPGGVGKTRLAIAVGRLLLKKFSDGVFFVSLETLNDPALLITQIARSLNIEAIRRRPLPDALKAYLRERHILLILDNFEQLIKAGPLVVDLLQASPDLKVLVTSREALHLYGEHLFIVPELSLPDPDHLPPLEALNQWPAVELFVQRVQARHPAFALTDDNKKLIVRICQRLDGLPLAIELAAAQVRLFSSDQVLPQLEHGLKFLKDTSTDRPSRQQTLWNAIDWSYQLLSETEKAIFRRLSVFGREWSLTAAQSVCQVEDPSTGSPFGDFAGRAPSTPNAPPRTPKELGQANQGRWQAGAGQALSENLEELTDKNLIRYVGQGEAGDARFQMLQPVREYAFEQLDMHAEAEQTQRRHAHYFVEMAQNAEPAIGTPEQLHWVRCVKQERENLQIALQWMLDRQEIEMAFTLLGAVWRYYNMLNIWDETQAWMERALTQGAHLKTAGRVKTLWGAYWLSSREVNHPKSLALAEEGLSLARELQDQRLIGLLLQCMVGELRYQSKPDQALQALQESLQIFHKLGDKAETAWVMCHISSFFAHQGNMLKAQEFLQESLPIFREVGDDWATTRVLRDLALLYWQQDNLEPIKNILEESLLLSEKTGERMGIAWTLNLQGRLALRQSNLTMARSLFEKAQVIFRELGDQYALSFNQEHMQELAALENKKNDA